MKNKAIEKVYQTMQSHQHLLKNRLNQVSQELISYGIYEIDTLTEFLVPVMNLHNRCTAVKRELLHRTFYSDMGQVQYYRYSVSYVGKTMLYIITINEQHTSIYEVLIHTLDQFIEALDI